MSLGDKCHQIARGKFAASQPRKGKAMVRENEADNVSLSVFLLSSPDSLGPNHISGYGVTGVGREWRVTWDSPPSVWLEPFGHFYHRAILSNLEPLFGNRTF